MWCVERDGVGWGWGAFFPSPAFFSHIENSDGWRRKCHQGRHAINVVRNGEMAGSDRNRRIFPSNGTVGSFYANTLPYY